MFGEYPDQLLVEARRGLLDALEALQGHQNDLVLVGSQAIYLHTDDVVPGVALFTKDADIALIPPLSTTPDIAQAMRGAGFLPGEQPGIWLDGGRQVDLLVPEGLAKPAGRRAARLDGHTEESARKVAGIEGAAVDNAFQTIRSLDEADSRHARVRVAGPAALLISKVFKLSERELEIGQKRLYAKDAFDAFRLLSLPTRLLAERMTALLADPRSKAATDAGLTQLARLFGAPESVGSVLAGLYVEGVGDPADISLRASILVSDLLRFLEVKPAVEFHEP